jgi:sulfhydrogenase subunit alpha
MKKISIDHLARVEGAGGITATIDGQAVTEVKFIVNEGPRLFERLTLGKTPEEDLNLVPRICAICSVSHHYAALRGLEKALDVKSPAKVSWLRELMHLGEMIESHSLHIFLLALPDYLGYPNAVAMAAKYGFEAKIGLEMKHFGNHIMKTMSGRFIHGENPVIGGFGCYPNREELIFIKNRAIQFLPFALRTVQLMCELNYPDIPESETLYVCCHPAGGKFGLVGDEIIISNGDRIDAQDYKKVTNEFVVSHSFCKHSQYKGKPYSVGALARINNLGERLEDEAGSLFKKYYNDRWKKNPLLNNAAQSLETLYAFERIPQVIDEVLKLEDPEPVKWGRDTGKGVGAVEAPRGILFHAYEIAKGRIAHTDIITPTAQNAEDIERYCFLTAQELLKKGQEDKIRDRMDLVVRSFDPCISCSAHMVQMTKVPADDWKGRLQGLAAEGPAVFIGLGREDRSDDRAGLELARRLRDRGLQTVWLEQELAEAPDLEKTPGRFILLDAVDFGDNPGKVCLLPLRHVLWNASLSHRLASVLSAPLSYQKLTESYLLGIQPASILEGSRLSVEVEEAVDTILKALPNSGS